MKIILIRHAIAEARGPEWEARDDERPLTREGIRKFREAVKGLRKLGMTPHVVLTSPLVRAQHTASWLLAGLRQRGLEARDTDALRPDRPARLPEEIRDLPPNAQVVLIGHEPHLSRLASYLLAGHEELRLQLKKGGMMILSLEDPNAAGTAVLECLLTQKQLRQLA